MYAFKLSTEYAKWEHCHRDLKCKPTLWISAGLLVDGNYDAKSYRDFYGGRFTPWIK